MSYLPTGMDPGISAPGSGDAGCVWLKLADRVYQPRLNAGWAILSLPPGEGCTMVFDFQGKTRHGPTIAQGRLAGNLRAGLGAIWWWPSLHPM